MIDTGLPCFLEGDVRINLIYLNLRTSGITTLNQGSASQMRCLQKPYRLYAWASSSTGLRKKWEASSQLAENYRRALTSGMPRRLPQGPPTRKESHLHPWRIAIAPRGGHATRLALCHIAPASRFPTCSVSSVPYHVADRTGASWRIVTLPGRLTLSVLIARRASEHIE